MKTIKHKLTDTHPDGIKWMLNKEFIFVKDILELINEHMEREMLVHDNCLLRLKARIKG